MTGVKGMYILIIQSSFFFPYFFFISSLSYIHFFLFSCFLKIFFFLFLFNNLCVM